jgi:hypothetical protein
MLLPGLVRHWVNIHSVSGGSLSVMSAAGLCSISAVASRVSILLDEAVFLPFRLSFNTPRIPLGLDKEGDADYLATN